MANITTQTIRVDLSTGKVIPTAFTHQNDTARTLVFDMYNGGLPYTMTGNTVKFAYKSPVVDGQYTVIAGSSMESGTVSGNKVTVTLPSAYTAISGVGMLTMIITPTSGTVRPVNIRLVVQKSADGANEIAGASDFPTTLQQIADEWYDENIANWLNENIESVYDAEAFGTAIDSWLDDHPEATTTVEDGSITVSKFASDAESILKRKNVFANIEFLHEEAENCGDPTLGFGACCVIWNDDTCIVNDFGSSADGSTLPNFLAFKNIGKVDAVIVSHYHGDHINSTTLNAFVNSSVDLSGCTFYLPHKGIDRTQAINSTLEQSNETTIKGILSSKNIAYIEPNTEGYEVEVGDFTINFYNVTSALFTNYYSYKWYSKGSYETDSTRYNNFSMCANVNIGGVNIFLSGDIEEAAQDNMASHVAKADVYMIPHHGRNLRESQSLINSLSCRVGVIPTYCDLNGGSTEGILCPSAGRCRELGTLVSTLNKNVRLIIGGDGVYSDSSNDIQNGVCLGQIIRQGTDFDDLGFGDHYCSGTADIATFVNAPPFPPSFARTFTVHVEPLNANATGDNRIVQKVSSRSAGTTSEIKYSRVKIDTWSDWMLGNVPFMANAYPDIYPRVVSTQFNYKFSPNMIGGFITTRFTDYNTMKEFGFYLSDTGGNCVNKPANAQCYLIVLNYRNSSGALRVRQIAIQASADSAYPTIYQRTFWADNATSDEDSNGSWSAWFSSASA